jgi:hypothetical protein
MYGWSSGLHARSSSEFWSANVNQHQQANPDLDQAEEDILTCDVSDEALEAAAGTARGFTAMVTDCGTLEAVCC